MVTSVFEKDALFRVDICSVTSDFGDRCLMVGLEVKVYMTTVRGSAGSKCAY